MVWWLCVRVYDGGCECVHMDVVWRSYVCVYMCDRAVGTCDEHACVCDMETRVWGGLAMWVHMCVYVCVCVSCVQRGRARYGAKPNSVSWNTPLFMVLDLDAEAVP